MGRLATGIVLFIWVSSIWGTTTGYAWEKIQTPAVYQQITGGCEEYRVQKGDRLAQLAILKGVRWRVLARHNKLKKRLRLKPGMILKINNTHIIPAELDHGLVINLPELMLYFFEDGEFKGRYSLAVGRRTWQTPTGEFEIINKVRNPTWLVPPSIQREMAARGKPVLTRVPPGPKNPLGPYWMATSAPGVGLHATPRPWTVGHFVSHGCLRMLKEEIAELFDQVKVGTPVKIIYKPFKLAVTPERRVYLEVHPDIYRKGPDPIQGVENLIKSHHLESLVDWKKVYQVIKNREGIAADITKTVEPKTIVGQKLSPGKEKKTAPSLPES